MDNLVFALWFFWPAAIGNGLAVVAHKVPLLKNWDTPMDFGWSFDNKRILGANKTWRGFVFGVFAAAATAFVQYYIWLPEQFRGESVWFMVLLGGLLGFGALFGDAVESFIKRRLSVKPGNSWFPFDQLDYIFGGILISSLLVELSWQVYAWIIVLYFGVHLLSTYIFFKLGVRQRPI